MAKRHIFALTKIGEVEIYCFDISNTVIKNLQSSFPKVILVTDLNSVTDRSFDGCIIAAPTPFHIDYMEWSLDKKIPFLVEKPINSDEKNILPLIKKVRSSGLFAGVAFPRRHSAGIRILAGKLKQGDIGELKSLRLEFSQDFRKYRPDYAKTYYANTNTGGGILMDALSHHVDLACLFAGTVSKVSCFYDKLVFDNVEVEDTAALLLKFKNGILGSITGNQFQKPNTDFIELIGTKGSMRYERVTGMLSINMSETRCGIKSLLMETGT